jgi:hypothetical protein
MIRKAYFLIAVSLMSLLVGAAIAHAQGPQPGGNRAPSISACAFACLTYQGRLTDSNGAPINSTVNMVFKLYDSSNVLRWTSATRSVTPVNGLFTVYLGDNISDPQLYSGNLSLAAFIGVTVDGDAEMSPRQPLNTVVGHGFADTGVVGSSVNSFGVSGKTNNQASAGVMAIGAGLSGTALEIDFGGIKVFGAGVNANTPVFVHQVSASACPTQNGTINCNALNQTIITHALTDSKPAAILIITPSSNYDNLGGGVNNSHPVGVFYNNSLSKWVIYNIDGTAMSAGQQFNVLVVTP